MLTDCDTELRNLHPQRTPGTTPVRANSIRITLAFDGPSRDRMIGEVEPHNRWRPPFVLGSVGVSPSASSKGTFSLNGTVAKPVTLTVRCRRCAHAANLSYIPEDAYSIQGWVCPSISCKAVQPITLKGTLVSS